MQLVSCSQCNHPVPKKGTDVIDGKRVCHRCKKLFKRTLEEMGQVQVWKMTEEQRLAYIEKYPIKPKTRQERDGKDG